MLFCDRIFLLVITLLTFHTVSTAQIPGSTPPGPAGDQPYGISGRVVDASTGQPVEFATVTVFDTADSSLVDGTVTEATGGFFLGLKPGSYFVQVEFISYRPAILRGIVLNREEPIAELGTIRLETDAKMLLEVEVRAEKSQMQLSLDKKVFNVGKDLANLGGTASDVLNNVPSVTVDVEGNVELRGSGGVRILIDGKPSGLVGLNGTSGLQQIPANLIDRVEIITNPSARYEAEGMAGIINIILKKDRRNGFNGAADLTLGHPAEYGAAFNLNYRKEKLNFFVNYGLRYRKGPGSGNQTQSFERNDTTFITQQTSRRERGGLSNSFRGGADYFFNERNILTSAFTYRIGDNDNFNKITYRDFLFDTTQPTGITYRTDDETELDENLEYSLSYRKLFEREGREFTADFRFQDNREDERSDFLEQSFTPDGDTPLREDLRQRSANLEQQRNLILQADYVHPFAKDGKFEAGLRNGIRNINNNFKVEENIMDMDWDVLPGLTNNFIYDENIYALYGILGNKVDRYSWQVGLRAEYSDIRTELVQNDSVNDRTYANLFPSVFLGYEMSDKNAFQVSYSRRIRRPDFRDLNPFFSYSDARNFRSGNPNLDPEFTDSYEIGFLRYFENGSVTTSMFFRHTDQVIENIREQLSDVSALSYPVNLSTRNDYGLEVTGAYDLLKRWRVSGNANFFRSQTDGTYKNQVFRADTYTWFGRLSSRVTLWRKLDVQVNVNYRAPRNTTQGRSKAFWHVDPAASIDLFQGNATLTFSVRDLFNTRRWRYITEGYNFYTEGDFQWRARQSTLTFSYRLNQQPQKGRDGKRGGGFEGDGGDF
ncbi:MAG: hypothetical protein RLY31_766 [Bacteroidota bacterium]